MTARLVVTCDDVHCGRTLERPGESMWVATMAAQCHGWLVTDDDVHLCPDCRPRCGCGEQLPSCDTPCDLCRDRHTAPALEGVTA